MLAVGLVALLGVDLLPLRTAFSPLDELADTTRRHDPLAPGARADVPGRHADASHVELELHSEDGGTVLTIRDDGRGMPPGSLTSSNGIRGMRERAMLIGAGMTIESRPEQGTEVRLTIPNDTAEDPHPDR